MIAWKVLEDKELLYEGSFAIHAALRSGDGPGNEMMTRGPQLVPLVRVKARALLQRQETEGNSNAPSFIEFPIDSDALTIERADVHLQRPREEHAVEKKREWTCRLELQQKASLSPVAASEKSWFDIKIHRAATLRARGNEAFKSGKLKAAIRSYKKVRAYRINIHHV